MLTKKSMSESKKQQFFLVHLQRSHKYFRKLITKTKSIFQVFPSLKFQVGCNLKHSLNKFRPIETLMGKIHIENNENEEWK